MSRLSMVGRWLCLAALVSSLCGCTIEPPFTREQAMARIVSVCHDKYHLTVTPQRLGDTLYVSMAMPGIVRRIAPAGKLLLEDVDKIIDLYDVTTQISLSARPAFQFYVLRVSDPEQPGVELRYVRYLDDVRRAAASALAESEYFARLIRETKASAEAPLMSDAWMGREVRLGEFLAAQIALRLKDLAAADATVREEYAKLSQDEQRLAQTLKAWRLEDCAGWFGDETFLFAFSRKSSEEAGAPPPATAWPPEMLGLIARILAEYGFHDYHAVTLRDLTSQTTSSLSPAELAAYFIKR